MFVSARWEIIEVNLKLLMVGNWDVIHLPRIAVALVVVATTGGLIAGLVRARQFRRGTAVRSMPTGARIGDLVRRFGILLATVLLLLALTTTAGPWLMSVGIVVGAVVGRLIGGVIGGRRLPRPVNVIGVLALVAVPFVLYFYLADAVPLARWEGFFFNVTSAMAGILLSFPLGVLLALGRRSRLPLLRAMATGYIEFVRGSPCSCSCCWPTCRWSSSCPRSRPERPGAGHRGVHAVHRRLSRRDRPRRSPVDPPWPGGGGPVARAVPGHPDCSRIVLPQALRNVIPAQIGQFISLFKDTTLAGLGLGILEMLAVSEAITQQPDFRARG